jgi:hypothetical protein
MFDEFERYRKRMKKEIYEKKVKLENLKRDIKYKLETVSPTDKSGKFFFNYLLIFFFNFLFSFISAHLNQMAAVKRLVYQIEKLERRFR